MCLYKSSQITIYISNPRLHAFISNKHHSIQSPILYMRLLRSDFISQSNFNQTNALCVKTESGNLIRSYIIYMHYNFMQPPLYLTRLNQSLDCAFWLINSAPNIKNVPFPNLLNKLVKSNAHAYYTIYHMNRFKTLENEDQFKTLIYFNQPLIKIEYQHNKLTSPYSNLQHALATQHSTLSYIEFSSAYCSEFSQQPFKNSTLCWTPQNLLLYAWPFYKLSSIPYTIWQFNAYTKAVYTKIKT